MLKKILGVLFAVLVVIAMLLSGCAGGSNDQTQTAGDHMTNSGYPAGEGAKGPASTAYPGP